LKGELFVSSGFGALEVLLRVVSLELDITVAALVAVKLVLSKDPAEVDGELSPDAVVRSEVIAVSVNVDFCVVVLPFKSVVV
jgi:hypothetical protein